MSWHVHDNGLLTCIDEPQQWAFRLKKNDCLFNKLNSKYKIHISPPLVHLCFSSVVLSWTPAVATKGRQRADAVLEDTGPLRHLGHSVFCLLFSVCCSSPSAATPVQACSGCYPSLDALFWAPAAAQALAALWTGTGRANAGRVVRGGARDRHLAGTVSSCHRLISLQT